MKCCFELNNLQWQSQVIHVSAYGLSYTAITATQRKRPEDLHHLNHDKFCFNFDARPGLENGHYNAKFVMVTRCVGPGVLV